MRGQRGEMRGEVTIHYTAYTLSNQYTGKRGARSWSDEGAEGRFEG